MWRILAEISRIDKNAPRSKVAIGEFMIHVLINCLFYLTIFILGFYTFFVAMRLTGRYLDRKQDRLMLRNRYVEARNQSEQMQLVVAKEPWRHGELRESLIKEMDALEKYLARRGKRSGMLECQAILLANYIDTLAVC
jgi:hypothetical protein